MYELKIKKKIGDLNLFFLGTLTLASLPDSGPPFVRVLLDLESCMSHYKKKDVQALGAFEVFHYEKKDVQVYNYILGKKHLVFTCCVARVLLADL